MSSVLELKDLVPGIANCDGCKQVKRVVAAKVYSRYGPYLCATCLRELAEDLDRMDGH
jgi:hypothetical protein